MKIVKLLIYLLSTPSFLWAQSPQENLDKYFYYRKRFEEKFIVKHVITPEFDNKHELFGVNLPASTYNTKGQYISDSLIWSDATSYLGQYIATLATEYKVLKNYNQDLRQTKIELACALQKIELLDLLAEDTYGQKTIWKTKIPPYSWKYEPSAINGFFIRDDIYEGFVTYWREKGHPFETGLKERSDLIMNGNIGSEMSQDQVWHLLYGLALVKALVDDNQHFFDLKGQYITLQYWAQKITYRLVTYMHHVEKRPPLPDKSYWEIKNAVTGNTVERGGSRVDVELSGHSFLFSDICDWITEEQFGEAPHPGYGALAGDLEALENLYVANGRLMLSIISPQYPYTESFNMLMRHIIRIAYRGSYIDYNQPWENNYSHIFGLEYLPLTFLLLHSDDVPNNDFLMHCLLSYVEKILNLAPTNGSHRYKNGSSDIEDWTYPNPEWAIHSRLESTIGHFFRNINSGSCDLNGEWNGLDYMLIHNLFLLVQDKMTDKKLTITTNIPYKWQYGNTSFTFGSSATDDIPLTIYSQKQIEVINELEHRAQFHLKGKGVLLSPEFKMSIYDELKILEYDILDLDFSNNNIELMNVPNDALIRKKMIKP